MEHVAIMKKSWGLTGKILKGKKRIESRWYKTKRKPWDAIKARDTVYFKNSGEPGKIKADKVKDILEKYGEDDGIERKRIPEFYERFKDKKYCILIFLKNPRAVKPFEIDKSDFGSMSAWITIDKIEKLKIE